MTDAPKSIPPEQIFGTAKKMHLELEKLNLVDHAAVINMLNTAAQHREMAAKFERAQAEERARQDAYEQAQAAHDRAEVERQRRLAEQMKAHLTDSMKANPTVAVPTALEEKMAIGLVKG